jgi:hypothetical protein
MWFIFPQIAGLGNSAKARKFSLASAAEAAQFAAHDELGPRLFEATEALLDWAGTLSAEDILGPVDTVKLRNSMTLFEAACSAEDAQVLPTCSTGSSMASAIPSRSPNFNFRCRSVARVAWLTRRIFDRRHVGDAGGIGFGITHHAQHVA